MVTPVIAKNDPYNPSALAGRLANIFEIPLQSVKVQHEVQLPGSRGLCVDYLATIGHYKFVVEYRVNASAAELAVAIGHARQFAHKADGGFIPLVVAPYIGDVGAKLCAEAKVSWLDLSGNARISAPGLRIHIEGKPNLFKRVGRPGSLFAPRSSRLVRCLLMEPERAFTQRELSKKIGLDEGFVSRLVKQLLAQQLVIRTASGEIKVANRGALLEGWREAYDFSQHQVRRGHIPATAAADVSRHLSSRLRQLGIEHAFTGPVAADQAMVPSVQRPVIVYVARMPSTRERKFLGFLDDQENEVVWLAEPDDARVLDDIGDRCGLPCVCQVQLFLDLKDLPVNR